MDDAAPSPGYDGSDRRRWLGVLAKARVEEVEAAFAALAEPPGWRRLRAPESGLALVRGRISGDGAPFNFGEMTMTRCAVTLDGGGSPGFCWVAGRSTRHAELAAVFDGLLQRGDAEAAAQIEALAAAQAARRRVTIGAAAPTRVEFFTMTRE